MLPTVKRKKKLNIRPRLFNPDLEVRAYDGVRGFCSFARAFEFVSTTHGG